MAAASPASFPTLGVFGAGYVGLVTAACFAHMGHRVVCVDRDAERVRRLRHGELPFYEPALPELVQGQMRSGRLRFSDQARDAVAHGELLFIAVGTPPDEDGAADLSHVLAVADEIGRHMGDARQVVVKSTVPVGACERVLERLRRRLRERGLAALEVAVASNPEFLREGRAISDFLRPDRVVAGSDDTALLDRLRRLYAPLTSTERPFLAMGLRSAEMSKYAANAMLAARLSLMNELALVAERLGADIEQVREGVGSDARIGAQFLRAGCGYGGSCLPKDLRALRHGAARVGQETPLLDAVEAGNERMKRLLEERVCAALGEDLSGRRIAVWGLAFKPHTDDLREAPGVALVQALCARGATVCAHDPQAGEAARRLLGGTPGFQLANDALEAADQADALVLVTEWPQFRALRAEQLRDRMRQPLVFDGRNALDAAALAAAGMRCIGIGRGGPLAGALPRAMADAGGLAGASGWTLQGPALTLAAPAEAVRGGPSRRRGAGLRPSPGELA
ncbi:UDP-glucose/GDP-mannose dehydrogenase family protein [Pelomonas sp. CA6]|uniref:UDP-glucose dehydrogenase family protein n=1 Tax=Pelomonas sp. CA6 TaxID=2907999 RepID=UPI001F4BDFC2|nr:UDP-glucose/GDP-mannose dehydrogenase family protein [Pelomonas sp. CA6]MCH7344772.1 UDP-glucose/GDP-mannose dehydrogenase family protein [Pelomonas sp. CA6]